MNMTQSVVSTGATYHDRCRLGSETALRHQVTPHIPEHNRTEYHLTAEKRKSSLIHSADLCRGRISVSRVRAM